MSANSHFSQLAIFGNKIEECIENELWEEADQFCQQWDEKIRTLINSLSAEQFVAMGAQIENVASQNARIKKHLIKLRAKVLTQLQENNTSQTAIQQYQNIA